MFLSSTLPLLIFILNGPLPDEKKKKKRNRFINSGNCSNLYVVAKYVSQYPDYLWETEVSKKFTLHIEEVPTLRWKLWMIKNDLDIRTQRISFYPPHI